MLKVVHVFSQIQNEYSAFSQGKTEYKKKLKGHHSNIKNHNRYMALNYDFICYENESNVHISYSYRNHKTRPSWF